METKRRMNHMPHSLSIQLINCVKACFPLSKSSSISYEAKLNVTYEL
uniref:Uncharacterized protein n=1 Tax=Lotus japonicus TaxID=34305 RepID=I3S7Y3_LOTJA|nr:unknown [Lotus japonicus]